MQMRILERAHQARRRTREMPESESDESDESESESDAVGETSDEDWMETDEARPLRRPSRVSTAAAATKESFEKAGCRLGLG